MDDPVVLVDGWELDVAAHMITKGQVIRRLEPKAMQVLVALAAQPGAVISRSELLTNVWGGAFVGDDAVSAAVIKIRRAFEDDARSPRVIETVHKSGYRLIATVTASQTVSSVRRHERTGAKIPSVKFATLLRCTYRTVSLDLAPVGPEEWQRATDAMAGSIGDIIKVHGGVPIHESGATIGVFGAPVAQEHHAMRAVQAALDIRALTTATPESMHDRLDYAWRIGLASGEVLSSAPPRGGAFSVHGAALEHAASLAVAAEPGEILLTAETNGLAEGLVGAQLCDPHPKFTGFGDVYRIRDDAGWRTPWEARVERGLTPLFGRDFELNRIKELLEGVTAGNGRVVAMVGEPGAGKSRLIHEALLLASARGFETLIARASPLEARTPFFAVRAPVLSRLDLDPEAFIDAPALQDQLRKSGTDGDATALLAALQPDGAGDDWTSLDPDIRMSRTVAALAHVIVDSTDLPQLIVFENLHWADETTRHLVDAVAIHIARRPCLLAVTYRPEFIDPWATKSYYTHLRIDALTPADSIQMLDHLVGDDASVEKWKASVVGLAGGTPLFIEEVVKSARASDTLIGKDGVLRLTEGGEHSTVPPSIHTLIADRIDRLSDGAQAILSLAAVIGNDVPASVLHPLLPGHIATHFDELEELQAAELLFAAGYQRDSGYVFKHAVTQDVAYQEIPPSIRHEHHRRIAELLGTLTADGVPFSPELVARHHVGAGQKGLAIGAWIRAADSAISAAAFADALEHLKEARSCLLGAPANEQNELALTIDLRTISALIQSVGPADPEVDAVSQRARELAFTNGSARQQFQAAWGSWFVHLMRGEINAAQPLGDEVFELAETLNDQALQLEAHHVQWSGLSLAGHPNTVREHAKICIEQYEPSEHHWLTFSYGGHDPGVCAWNLDAMALWLLGQPDLARKRSARAITLAEELGHPYTRLESYNSALNIALLDAEADALLTHADVLLALVDNHTLPDFASAYANGFRANALVLQGDVASGLDLMVETAPVWREFWGAWCFPLDSAFATTLGAAGRLEEAIADAEMQLDAARWSGAHWWDAEFHRVLGELLLAQDPTDLDRAKASFETAIEVSRQQPSPFLELRAASSLARIHAAEA